MEKKIFVNSEENVCRVTLTCDEGTFMGVATCSSEDKFDVQRGLDLAEKRALMQVKNVDIKQFKDELAELNRQKEAYLGILAKCKKTEGKILRAKNCLASLYQEIGELSK